MDTVVADVLFCMPASIAALLFLATVGGWGIRRKAK